MSSSSDSSEDDSDSPQEDTEIDKHQLPATNAFKNDGSFLEMFKKMQEAQSSKSQGTSEGPKKEKPKSGESSNAKKYVGKRRLGRVLPTGMVKKKKKEATQPPTESLPKDKKKDPWSTYLAEVKRYKQQSCSDEDSNRRPLVK